MAISFCAASKLSRRRASAAVRLESAALAVALGGFVVLIALAMVKYPGGTSWDPTTRGHDFWLNYLCDLERQTALNGQPNVVGSQLARVALFFLATAAVSFWWSMPRLFSRRAGLVRAVRALGALSTLGILGAASLPSDRFGALHPFLMALGVLPGLGAGACAVVGLARHERTAASVGAAAAVAVAVDFALYGGQLASGDAGLTAVAVMERASLILLLVWMALTAWRARRPSPSLHPELAELVVERAPADPQ